MEDEGQRELLRQARAAAETAYVPYSGFPVGAAVRTVDGRVFLGCNVENASYGLTCCAERTAVFSAVAMGTRSLAAVAVWAPKARPCVPCGACRQVLYEFGGPGLPVILEGAHGELVVYRLSHLLPEAFGPHHLHDESE